MFKTEKAAIAIHTNLGAIFVSLELSRSIWLITSLSPGNGERMSKHSLRAGDVAGLFGLLSKMRERCRAKTRNDYAIVTIQEAGSTASGSIACLRRRGSKVMSWMQRRLRHRAATDG